MLCHRWTSRLKGYFAFHTGAGGAGRRHTRENEAARGINRHRFSRDRDTKSCEGRRDQYYKGNERDTQQHRWPLRGALNKEVACEKRG